MDFYIEYMVKRKKDTRAKACVIGIFSAAAILTIVMIFLIFACAVALTEASIGQFAFSVGFLLIALMWYFAVFLAKKFNIEYEYIMTNNFVDIDKIMSKSQRKRIVSFDLSEIELCANIADNDHNSEYKRENPNLKVYDMTGDKDAGGVYFVDFSNEGTRSRVLFQPTAKMMENAKRYNPRCIFLYEDRF